MSYVFETPSEETITRFKAKIRMAGPDECWEWSAARIKFGYGHFTVNKRSHKAHRLAFEWLGGSPVGNAFVLHRCDNPPCCNPRHLFLGSAGDNVGDMVRKGRFYGGARHHLAKFSERDVDRIFALRASGMTLVKISAEIGCTHRYVGQVLAGITRSQNRERPPLVKLLAHKLSQEDKAEIISAKSNGATTAELAARYAVSMSCVRGVIRHQRLR